MPVLGWNTDKAYLVDLIETGLPVVPTVIVDEEGELAPAIAAFAPAVVKPRVGAGGAGVVLFDAEPGGPADLDESPLRPGRGSCSRWSSRCAPRARPRCSCSAADVVSQAQKRPAGDEIRVHEEYGGRTVVVPVTQEAADLALEMVRVAERRLGVPWPTRAWT